MAIYKKVVKLKNGKDLLLRNAEEFDAEKMITYLNAVGGESDNLLFGKDGFHLTIEQEREYLKNAKENPDMLMLLG
ncbi:MAG TPA: N-acetyltransferase, partial [Clostridiales bacterium]|nr:N-acetyltransferase [Clostridiales bacterium]